jgi:Asp-tRNA(Asn)/Glu-tRNA(Gln) amidotransferase A subunit family amidase
MLGRFVRLTRPISYLGLPVVVASAGFTRAGMPIGMQLIAPPLDEATALRAGHAFQRATDWRARSAWIGRSESIAFSAGLIWH